MSTRSKRKAVPVDGPIKKKTKVPSKEPKRGGPKSAPTKKVSTKKAPTKKASTKKAPVKKLSAKKPPAKKAAAKNTTTKEKTSGKSKVQKLKSGGKSKVQKCNYVLRTEEHWNSWGKRGINHGGCDKKFSSIAEAVVYAPELICNFEVFDEEDYGSIDVDYRDEPASAPGNGVILQTTDMEGEVTKVFIETWAVDKTGGKLSKGQKNGTYVLRTEEHWNSWGKSGINHDGCDKKFSSIAEAVAYAPELICNFEVFDEENYGSIDVDYRDDPASAPENGVILQTTDMKGEEIQVIIERVA